MNKAILATSLLCAATWVSACFPFGLDSAGANSASTAAAPEELPPGFYLGGEFVELGPFDPQDSSIDPIRACEEVPEEVFEAVGLVAYPESRVDVGDATTCSIALQGSEEPLSGSITGSFATFERLREESIILDENPSQRVSGIVAHQDRLDADRACHISAETSRGHLAIVIEDFSRSTDEKILCSMATQTFESIYFQLRGTTKDADQL